MANKRPFSQRNFRVVVIVESPFLPNEVNQSFDYDYECGESTKIIFQRGLCRIYMYQFKSLLCINLKYLGHIY